MANIEHIKVEGIDQNPDTGQSAAVKINAAIDEANKVSDKANFNLLKALAFLNEVKTGEIADSAVTAVKLHPDVIAEINSKIAASALAAVATSGNYNDLTNLPDVSLFGTSVTHNPADPVPFTDLRTREIGAPAAPFTGQLTISPTNAVPGASCFVVYQAATPLVINGATVIDWTADQFVANKICIYFLQYLASGSFLLTGVFPEKEPLIKNESISASRTVTAADYEALLRLDTITAQNIELPDDAHLPSPTNFYLDVEKVGAGDLTFVATGAATVLYDAKISTQGQTARAERVLPNTWKITGGNA